MQISVFNPSFEKIGIIEMFESLIWTDKFYTYGDFEIVTDVTANNLILLSPDNYLSIPDSDRIMVIESIQIKTNVETGPRLISSGRSFESILDRRIILQQTLIDGSLQLGIKKILDENAISSTQPERDFPGFSFTLSGDPVVTGKTLVAQYDGENVYAVIQYLCQNAGIGFRILKTSQTEYSFSLYNGSNRAYDQTTNPFVIFSPKFDNLMSTDYYYTNQFYKTYTLVFGDAYYGGPRPRIPVGMAITGLSRREILTDAADLSKFDAVTGLEIPIPTYNSQAAERGRANLIREHGILSTFDGDANPDRSYKYGTDYFLGDYVQIENEYGFKGKIRVTEVLISENENGTRIFPTFTTT